MASDPSRRLDDVRQELEALRRGYDQRRTTAAAASEPTAAPSSTATPGRNESPARAFRETSDAHPGEVRNAVVPSAAELRQAAALVLHSPFITENLLYAERLGATRFVVAAEDFDVNAFACEREIESKSGKRLAPHIVFKMGMATVHRLLALAVAASAAPGDRAMGSERAAVLRTTLRRIAERTIERGGIFEPADSLQLIEERLFPTGALQQSRVLGAARDCAAAMDAFVIAHEAGHLALGHTLGSQRNYDVSRNQEREADSFAASVTATTPFRTQLFLGMLFTPAIFAWLEHLGGGKITTHPAARERFANAIRSLSGAAAEAADAWGFTPDALQVLLPT